MNYEIPQKEVIFPYKSFQEYIDTYVTLEKVGANDYQQFIKMMNIIMRYLVRGLLMIIN